METAADRFAKDIAPIMERLNARVNAIEGRTVGGLLAAGLKVQRLSQKMVPVEFGKLKASAYTRKAMENALAVEVGYSAEYAVWVHENIGMVLKGEPRPPKMGYSHGIGVYWGPHGRAKFLQFAYVTLSDEIVKTVAAFARKAQGKSA